MKYYVILKIGYDGILFFSKHSFFVVLFLLSAFPGRSEATDYKYLTDVIKEVKSLRAHGASNHEIADFVNEIVDNRVMALNRVGDYNWKTTKDHTFNPNEKLDKWRKQPVDDLYFTAVWTWENRVGQCEEHAKLSYYILKEAGIDKVRMVGWGLGNRSHLFVVIGLEEDLSAADIANPHYWSDHAFAIDPWQGKVLNPHEAWVNSYIGNKGQRKLVDSTYSHSGKKIPKDGLKPLMWNSDNKTWECKEGYCWDFIFGCVRYRPIDRGAKHLTYDYRTEAWICNPPFTLDEKSGRCVLIHKKCDCNRCRNTCDEFAKYYRNFKEKRDKALAKGQGVRDLEGRMNGYKYHYDSNCCDECFGPIETTGSDSK
jgi:hypothetical protein